MFPGHFYNRNLFLIKHLSDRLSAYMHAHTLLGSIRPFGCSLILSSYEALPQNKQAVPQLFMIDPSGLSNGYIGCAVGKSRQFAKTEIEKLKVQNLTCKELVNEAARIIYGAHEEAETREKPFELELSWVCEATGGRHELVPPAILSAANDYAKARMREAEAEDEEMPAAQ
jgi:20S proteasome subunit alpha 7